MKKLAITYTIILACFNASAQTATQIISGVFDAQKHLKTVSYTLTRTDTLVTGDVRTMTGSAKIMLDITDTVFGFKFWS